jgi:cation diffusion facilitator family transporter
MPTRVTPRPTETRVLQVLLAINGGMFVAEIGFGMYAQSMGLVGDALDMLADAAVYGLALHAVGRSVRSKARAASVAGILQLVLGLGALIEVVRRWIVGSEPQGIVMIAVSCVALMANSTCLLLLRRHRRGEVHMRAAWVFSATDVQANLGVVIAGALVTLLRTPVPDLVVGAVVTALVLRGGIRILRDAAAT